MEIPNNIIDKMYEAGVVREGHFKLTSGAHSDTYIQKDRIWQHPRLRNAIIEKLCHVVTASANSYEAMLTFSEKDKLQIVGPAAAGTPWAAIVAHEFKLPFAYCEKSSINFDGRTIHDTRMAFERGFDKDIAGKPVMVIEDIVTTGTSVQKTIKSIHECGGCPVAVVCIWNRSGILYTQKVGTSRGVPINSLIHKEVQHWDPSVCPMCKKDQPLQNPKV